MVRPGEKFYRIPAAPWNGLSTMVAKGEHGLLKEGHAPRDYFEALSTLEGHQKGGGRGFKSRCPPPRASGSGF